VTNILRIERLSVFSSKFIYWSGLINIFTLLFAGLTFSLVIATRFVLISPIGILFLISIFPSDLFRKKILEHDNIAIGLQLLFLVIIAIANLIITINEYSLFTIKGAITNYFMLMMFPLLTIGIFPGVLPIFLMYIRTLIGLNETIIAPVILILALIYIKIILIHARMRFRSTSN